jgi:hypothetical protein
LPVHRIQSDKTQGEFYSRQNNGVGDLIVTADAQVFSAPHISLELGVKFATGSVDEVDELGQRICDILSLGSGTTDFLLGSNLWVPHLGLDKLDLNAGIRYRFSGGQNKWGYAFGDQASARAHISYPVTETIRTGLRFDAWHADKDTWFDQVVPERGATFVYAAPTLYWNIRDDISVGTFIRFPLYMNLEGSQMVSSYSIGLGFTTDLSNAFRAALGPLGLGQ